MGNEFDVGMMGARVWSWMIGVETERVDRQWVGVDLVSTKGNGWSD